MADAYRSPAAGLDAEVHRRSRAALPALFALAALAASGPVAAEPADIAGSWSGGGTMSFVSGAHEKARCRVRYSRKSPTSYAFTASCATVSGKVNQTASLRKTGENRYAGGYHNKEYNTFGTINVVVRGNTQSVSLTSDTGATGSLRLTR